MLRQTSEGHYQQVTMNDPNYTIGLYVKPEWKEHRKGERERE